MYGEFLAIQGYIAKLYPKRKRKGKKKKKGKETSIVLDGSQRCLASLQQAAGKLANVCNPSIQEADGSGV